MKNRYRLLFCVDSLHNGGAEKILIEYISRLRKSAAISLLVLCDYGVYFDRVPNDVKCYVWPRMTHDDRDDFNRLYFDVEIAFLEGLAAKYIAGRNNQSPKICWIHTNLYQNNWCASYFKGYEQMEVYGRMDSIVFVSRYALDGYIKAFGRPKKYSIFHNCVNYDFLDNFSSAKNAVEYEDKEFVICASGRLIPSKRFDLLIDSIVQLRKRVPNKAIKLRILGDGDCYDSLCDQVKRENLTDMVQFLGFQKNPYIYMVESDVFISTSDVEGDSLVLKEAYYLGCPIISTISGGGNEFIEDIGAGFIVKSDSNAIASLLENLVNNHGLLRYEQGKMSKWCLKKYADVHVIEEWLLNNAAEFRLQSIGMCGMASQLINEVYRAKSRNMAKKVLEDFCESLFLYNYPWDYASGLVGAGMGLLICTKKVGTCEKIIPTLHNIDHTVFSVIEQRCCEMLSIKEGVLGLSLYLYSRLSVCVEEDDDYLLILREYVVYLIDWIYEFIENSVHFDIKEVSETRLVMRQLASLGLMIGKIERLLEMSVNKL